MAGQTIQIFCCGVLQELMLLQHVRTSASRNASAVCRAMEQFGREKLLGKSPFHRRLVFGRVLGTHFSEKRIKEML